MTATPTVIFSHGQESGPWGTKIRRLAASAQELGFAADSVDYTDLPDARDRVTRLVERHPTGAPLVLAGSSMGSYVTAAAAKQLDVDALFLLAPAFGMPGYDPIAPPLAAQQRVIVHGWNDDVVPVAPVIDFARADASELHLVDDGHRLTDSLDRIDVWFRDLLQRLVE